MAAATDRFYARGVRANGVDLIATEADVTMRTLYKHFATKDEPVAAYLEAPDEPALSALVRAITEVDGDVSDQFERLFKRFAEQCAHPVGQGCPFARIVCELRDPTDRQLISIPAHHKSAFKDWLAERLAAHDSRNTELVARQLLVLVDGAITGLLIHHDPEYAKAAGRAATTLVEAARRTNA